MILARIIELLLLPLTRFLAFVRGPQEFPGPTHQYQAPTAKDRRGPCPGINSLANHGFIDRSGFQIPVNHLIEQLSKVYHVDSSFLDTVPVQDAIDNSLTETLTDGTVAISIDRLLDSKVMEHDASLFHQDSYFGDSSHTPDPVLIQKLLDLSDSDVVTFKDLKEHQTNRILDSLRTNPEASFSEDDVFAMAEQAMFTLMLGHNNFASVPKKVLRDWAGAERLDSGYTPPGKGAAASLDGDLSGEVLLGFKFNIKAVLAENNVTLGS